MRKKQRVLQKKRLSHVILGIIIFSILFSTGCTAVDQTDENAFETLPQTTTFEMPVYERLSQVEIILGFVCDMPGERYSTSPTFAAQVDEMLEVLNQKAFDDGLNVTVKIRWLPADYTADLVNEGDEFYCDVYMVRSQHAYDLFVQGHILVLDDLVRNYSPSYYAYILENEHLISSLNNRENEPLYMLRTDKLRTDTVAVMMEKEIVDEYDVQITNISEYVTAMRKIKADGETRPGGFFSPVDFVREYMKETGYEPLYDFLLYSNVNDEEFTLHPSTQISEFRQGLELYLDLWHEGITSGYRNLMYSFALGQTYSVILPMSEFLTTRHSFPAGNEYVLFPLNVHMHKRVEQTGLVISANANHPDRIMMFIEWLYGNKENMEIWSYGGFTNGDGKFYETDDKGRISYQRANVPFYKWLHIAGNTIFNYELARVPHYLSENYIREYKQMLSVELIERKMPPTVDPDKHPFIYEESQRLMQNFSRYNQVLSQFFMQRDTIQIDTLITELQSAGLEDTVQELAQLIGEVRTTGS